MKIINLLRGLLYAIQCIYIINVDFQHQAPKICLSGHSSPAPHPQARVTWPLIPEVGAVLTAMTWHYLVWEVRITNLSYSQHNYDCYVSDLTSR